MGITSGQTRTPNWASPLLLTAALFVCLAVFAPFAGESIEDDRFWLAGFGFAWLIAAGGLAIWEGVPRFRRPAAMAYHAAAFVAVWFHLMIGAGVLFINTRAVAGLTTAEATLNGGGVFVGVAFLVGMTGLWLGLTVFMLRLWQQRSWWWSAFQRSRLR